MGLSKYREKRTFSDTPEPTGGKPKGGELIFVVQKHDASRLHYDFRLEMDGVLKSWAVPKGPSLDPAVKRLAMMVEDHPFDYRDFEGIIPKGNYGAGTVIVWDEGTYSPIEKFPSKKAQEKYLLQKLEKGDLKVVLNGKKLKGEFALVRTNGMGENSWLLIKHRDKYATTNDITLKDKSVQSGKTIEKIAASSKNIWESNKKTKSSSPKKTAVKKAAKKPAAKKKANAQLSGAPEARFPKTVSPMLATLVDKPFDEPGWRYEIKWDGYRAIALSNDGEVNLVSRNNKSFNEKFYPVFDAVKEWNINAVVDGEIAVVNESGISHFGSLQNWRSEADGDLIYYVFDLLWLDGHDLMNLPLSQRRDILRELVPAEGIIRISDDFQASGSQFLEAAANMGLEGIIAKKEDSVYRPGERTRDWLKIKVNKRHEVVIGGYTVNDGTAKKFSSLLVGVYENGKLEYTGKIGTGFNDEQQAEMMAKFRPIITGKSPFTSDPDVNKPSRFRPNPPHATVTWLKPELVCEVSYAEVTSDGVMRHPSFEGMREDKKPTEVMREKAVKTKDAVKKTAKKTSKKTVVAEKLLKPVGSKQRKTLLNPTEESQVKTIGGHELKFSNLSKIYWPKEKFTKRDLINYYYQVAPYILPYLKDRPQSLNRYPNGITGESFYQKDMTGKAPDWIELFPYTTSDEKDKNYMLCQKEADLLYMANLGCIEIHPWSSRVNKPENPDWCLIDLDPSDKNSFNDVIQVAQVTKKVLDAIGVEGYCKTSGSTGMHIYIPLKPKYSYDECQLFGRWIAMQVHEQIPDITSVERIVKKRKNKLYVDFLQNRPGATLAAPYSARPKPGGTVSMPLHWDEVKKGLKLTDYTIKNAMDRIKSVGDIFKGVLTNGIDLNKILKQLT
ncbi:MAG: DNA ligase D [Chitinophagaceae bacterium]|nr:DNA ligase D [Chitinophagaceae bacterium]